MSKFTIENAIDVQNKNLQDWKIILKDEIYILLQERLNTMNETLKKNDKISSVLRGSCLDTFVVEFTKNVCKKFRKENDNIINKQN